MQPQLIPVPEYRVFATGYAPPNFARRSPTPLLTLGRLGQDDSDGGDDGGDGGSGYSSIGYGLDPTYPGDFNATAPSFASTDAGGDSSSLPAGLDFNQWLAATGQSGALSTSNDDYLEYVDASNAAENPASCSGFVCTMQNLFKNFTLDPPAGQPFKVTTSVQSANPYAPGSAAYNAYAAQQSAASIIPGISNTMLLVFGGLALVLVTR